MRGPFKTGQITCRIPFPKLPKTLMVSLSHIDTEPFCPCGIPMQLALPPITQKNKSTPRVHSK